MASCALGSGTILDGFCAVEFPVDVPRVRSVVVDPDLHKIFVLERGSESIVHLADGADGDGIPDVRETVARFDGLNHGLAIHDGFVYASSDTEVLRWPLYANAPLGGAAPVELGFPLAPSSREAVVDGINADGQGGAPLGHWTRTLVFDELGNLYISVGSNKNVDPDAFRSRIRRVNVSEFGGGPLDFQTLEVFADGLRNEVGLAFDGHGTLWGVENSADNLNRADLGGDIHEDNPAEELNRFDMANVGQHYGYPYCWTEFKVPAPHGLGRGTVWAWPSFYSSGFVTDQDCRDDYVAPALAFQGHSAPLGITFYNWDPAAARACGGVGAFPPSMDGYAFIAYHGSWNRDVPTGYKVVYVPMDGGGNVIGDEPIDLLAHAPPNARWPDGFRPVDVAFDGCGRLLVTSDGTRNRGNWRGSKVVRIEYTASNPTDRPTPNPTNRPTPEPAPAPPPPASRVFVACGNKNNKRCVTPTLEAGVDEEHEVRCCSDASLGNGWKKAPGCSVWSESEIGVERSCFREKTFAFARDACEGVGARLCTLDEMTSNCSRGTGCSFDREMVWTGTPVPSCTDDASCDDGLQCTTNRCVNGVCQSEPVPGCITQAIVGGSSHGKWPAPRVQGADVDDLHDVRCCSDTAKSGWVKKNNCAVWGESDLPVCNRDKNFADAMAICNGQGGRLCTQKEIEDNCTRGSGCSFDHQHVWTSTPYISPGEAQFNS